VSHCHVQTIFLFFFEIYEVISEERILKIEEGQKIMEVSNMPSFLEAFHYYQMKNKPQTDELNLIYLPKYVNQKNFPMENYLDYYKQYLPLHSFVSYDSYFDESFLFSGGQKYDIIAFSVLQHCLYENEYNEFLNARLIFYALIYCLNHLEGGGKAIISMFSVLRKFTANIVIFAKMFFDDVELVTPEICNLGRELGTVPCYLVLKTYRGIDEKKRNLLQSVFSRMYQEDPSGMAFEKKDLHKHLSPLENLTLPDGKESKYYFIKNYNEKIYQRATIFFKQLLYYQQKKLKEIIHREKIINSVFWLRKYDLDYFERKNLEKRILIDMYAIHDKINFQFTHSAEKNRDVIPSSDLSQDLQKLANLIWLKMHLIDTRDHRFWNTIRRKIHFYRPMFKNIDLVKRTQEITGLHTLSQAWLKLYEILNAYPLIPKEKTLPSWKTFHLCEAPGNFISAIDYFIKHRTKIKKFDWEAQSLNPKKNGNAHDNKYGFIRNNPKRWFFGPDESGDITHLENLKFYSKKMKGCHLVTSDCGISDERENYAELIAKISFCQIVCILAGLDPQACTVIKVFQKDKIGFHIPALYSAFYFLFLSFRKLYIYKSPLNRQSPEFYIVGFDFKKTETHQKMLTEMIESVNHFDPNKHYFRNYQTSFVYQMEKAIELVSNNFIFEIERVIYYFDHYEELKEEKKEMIKTYIDKKNTDWLKHVGLIKQ
jgi:hypothetical protein